MNKEDLRIDGMNCSHCVMAVERELKQIVGLQVKRVSVGSAKVEFEDSPRIREQISAAIKKAGYELLQ